MSDYGSFRGEKVLPSGPKNYLPTSPNPFIRGDRTEPTQAARAERRAEIERALDALVKTAMNYAYAEGEESPDDLVDAHDRVLALIDALDADGG